MFLHCIIHKTTWVSPENRTVYQINHVCVGRKVSRAMQDVRVQRGADAASDHYPVLARMKTKKREVKRNVKILPDNRGLPTYNQKQI